MISIFKVQILYYCVCNCIKLNNYCLGMARSTWTTWQGNGKGMKNTNLKGGGYL